MSKKSDLEEAFQEQIDSAGLKGYKRNFLFDKPITKRHLDFAFTKEKVAVEVQGGSWSGGRHTRGAGYESDRHKGNEAQIRGWLVLEVTTTMITDGFALDYLNRALFSRRDD